jgi:hypothetical protein
VRAAGPILREGQSGRRVFLVDGERGDAEGLRDVLVGFGAGVFGEVEPAPDGAYANEHDDAPVVVRRGRSATVTERRAGGGQRPPRAAPC